jgi:hypothetical protein
MLHFRSLRVIVYDVFCAVENDFCIIETKVIRKLIRRQNFKGKSNPFFPIRFTFDRISNYSAFHLSNIHIVNILGPFLTTINNVLEFFE